MSEANQQELEEQVEKLHKRLLWAEASIDALVKSIRVLASTAYDPRPIQPNALLAKTQVDAQLRAIETGYPKGVS